MSYKAVIFDLDGTLLDTLEDIGTAVNRVLIRKGFPSHPINLYREFVGEGAQLMIMRALPAERCDADTVKTCLEEYLEEYGRSWNETTRPYEGIPDLLDTLVSRGIKLAVLSNKPEVFTMQCVNEFLSRWTFDMIIGENESIPRKPDPQGALAIVEHLHIRPEEFIYVGDSEVDMKTAKAAGMFAVGVPWGFRSREELQREGADILIEHPMEIVKLIS